MEFYRQCELVLGTTHQVAWIPENFAHVGRVIKLKKDGEWVNGWRVKSVGDRQDEEFVRNAERAHTKQREQSDI